MAAASTAPARRAASAAPAQRAPRPGSRSRAPGARAARPRSASRAALTPMPARLVPMAVGRTAVAVSGLADSGLVHRLTRGRLWIGALTTLLVGIVSLNVLALSFNASSSRVGRQADALDREISALRAKIATNGASNARVQAAAAKLGLTVPEPGAVGYLRPGPGDATVAAKRLASGELTSSPAAPVTPVGVPATTPSSPPATASAPAATQPTSSTPAPDPAAGTATPTRTASPPASPTGGGGVSAP
jgi:hypothetical protein